jgi:hypothetical protein
MDIYNGPLNPKTMPKEALRTWRTWKNQNTRCRNEKTKDFASYGRKGLSVSYSSREFIGWWLKNIVEFKGINPQCGRIDHSKGYSFDNIVIQSRYENLKEKWDRVGPLVLEKPVICYERATMKILSFFKSSAEASRKLGISRGLISQAARNRSGGCGGITFRFEGGQHAAS